MSTVKVVQLIILINTNRNIKMIRVIKNCLFKSNFCTFWGHGQIYTYRVLQTIQMKPILTCVWAELAVLGSVKAALNSNMKFSIG